jgi:hypothetical protein
MDGIADFFSPQAGQKRRAWLDGKANQAAEAARYYLGPTGIPERAGAAGNVAAMFSPGADMMDAATASGDLMRATSPLEAATAGAGMVGALGSMFIPGNAQRAGEALTRFGVDEAGALKLPGFGDGPVYRVEAPKYDSPGAGAVFYSPDPSYVANYLSPDRVLRAANVPDGTLDIRDPATAQQIMRWVGEETDRARGLVEAGSLSRVGSELRDMERLALSPNPSDKDASQALANLGMVRWRQGRPVVSGLAEREMLDAFGAPAMTIRESDGSPSLAFRSPEIAKRNRADIPSEVAALFARPK